MGSFVKVSIFIHSDLHVTQQAIPCISNYLYLSFGILENIWNYFDATWVLKSIYPE